jgi:mono/diheme cytochrome c family protein
LDDFKEDRRMSNNPQRWAALVLGLLTLVLVTGACGSASTQTPAGDATRGQTAWAQSTCGGCHGMAAEGSSLGPALAKTSLSVREITSIVRRGAPHMPKTSAAQLTNQDLADMTTWLANPVVASSGAQGPNPWTQSTCGSCHGASAQGGSAPGLAGTQRTLAQFQDVVRKGGPGMPAFSASQIGDAALQAMYAWLQGQTQTQPQNPWVQFGCGACHGANAQGGSAQGFAGERPSLAEFQRAVRSGRESMPAYSTSQISDQDLQRLYDWLTALP